MNARSGLRSLRPLAAALLAGACALWSFGLDPELAAQGRLASELRGLDWSGRVRVRWIELSEIRGVLHDELEATLADDFETDYRDAYVALGVLPRGIDLLAALLDLQQDQLVGLYSAENRTLFVVRELPVESYDPQAILVHELVHALQHQHFPELVDLLQGLQHNDDVVTAIAAAVEGDASLAMLALQPETGDQRTPEAAARFREQMWVDVTYPTGALAKTPRLLRVSLIFPYAYGIELAGDRFASGGNPALDALLRDPPLSTLRVEFPDDRDPVEFVRLPLEALQEALEPRGCRIGHDTVAGLLTLRVLFDEHGAAGALEAAAPHWSGDRFVAIHCPEGPELAWLTRWDEGWAAGNFAERYQRIASSVAASAGYAEPPRVFEDGRSALVVTSGLVPHVELLRGRSEIRSYATFSEWVAGDCFPEGCPGH